MNSVISFSIKDYKYSLTFNLNTRMQYKFRFSLRCVILGYETVQSSRLIAFEGTCCLCHQSQVMQADYRPYGVSTVTGQGP
jgi:hypothetical protein